MAPFSTLTGQRPRKHFKKIREVTDWETLARSGARDTETSGLRLRTPKEGVLFHSQPARVVLVFPRGGWGLWGKGLFFAASAALESGETLPRPELVPTDYSHPRWPCTQDWGDFGFCCRGRDACTRQKSPAWPSDPGGKGAGCSKSLCPENLSWSANIQSKLPLLPQTHCSSWAPPSRATLVP